jgi:pyruvate dehydrogenase E2 component (dihydrolipoamide acetyltransferase)
MPPPIQASSTPDRRRPATPLARAVASDLGVDLATVTGTGRGGRIRRADVEAAAVAGVVDSREHAGSGSATLPLRGAEPGTGSVPAAPAPTPAPAAVVGGEVEEVPLSAMRRTVARRLVESMQSAPHVYLTTTVDAEALLGLRAELNRQLQAGGQDLKVSVNDLIVKACAGLLRTTRR